MIEEGVGSDVSRYEVVANRSVVNAAGLFSDQIAKMILGSGTLFCKNFFF